MMKSCTWEPLGGKHPRISTPSCGLEVSSHWQLTSTRPTGVRCVGSLERIPRRDPILHAYGAAKSPTLQLIPTVKLPGCWKANPALMTLGLQSYQQCPWRFFPLLSMGDVLNSDQDTSFVKRPLPDRLSKTQTQATEGSDRRGTRGEPTKCAFGDTMVL